MIPEFTPFRKIPRLSRECIVTEKIDGTNASILVTPEGEVQAGSRTRWITPTDDNYGFAKWVKEHEDDLRIGLGIGHHFGEWWGQKIQRGYELTQKRFSLFNTTQWNNTTIRPACCDVVPVLYQGLFTTHRVFGTLDALAAIGSLAAPGFMRPEGIVIYHVAAGIYFKKTIEGDEAPKGKQS